MGIRVKEHTMYRRHEWGRKLQQWMGGILILAIVLCASVAPGHARSGGGHRGGGHGWRGHSHHGKHSWGGVGVSIGVGSYWWPYRYPYVYPYTYSPQIYVQPSQPLSIQPPSSPPV